MNVGELIEKLSKLSPKTQVIISSDPEGNDFLPLSEVERTGYIPQYGEIGLLELTDEDRRLGYTEEDVIDAEDHPDAVPAVCLWP